MNTPHDPNVTTDDDPSRAGDPLRTVDYDHDATETGQPISGVALAVDLPAVPGYRVVREIARGGMGRVLAAVDLTLDREVALKVLLPGAAADRFVRESKITARLPHPNIPPVHALGTLADGSPFLAMKLVAGRTLSAELKSADRPRLLRAFTQVCEAVGFAHSRGVIHRDLKPANVMVGAFDEVQVMDWGLAKVVGSEQGAVGSPADDGDSFLPSAGSLHTVQGTVLGTPAYMAPEVAAGRAATKAADVYGLGAILHTLLTGRPPYSGATAAEVLQKVTTTEPALFAGANSGAPPALVAICRKAMARDPAARYPSAEDVAADVRRWLADEPVSVYREPWSARAARWARGRKTTVVATGVLLLTTTIAATVTAALVWREEGHTKTQWERAEGEKVKATENADAAVVLVHDLSRYVRQVEAAGSQSFTAQDRRQSLDVALAGYERLLALNPNDEALRSSVAPFHRFRANLTRAMNEMGEAEKSYREASRLYGELAAAHPQETSYRIEHALTSRDYAQLVSALGRLKESAEILDAPIREVGQMAGADPSKPAWQRTLALLLLDRSELNFYLGRYGDAERDARRCAEIYAHLLDMRATPEPLDPLFRGMAEIRLATALRELDRIDDALSVHQGVVERFTGLTRVTPSREFLSELYRAQAERAVTSMRRTGNRAEAVADLEGAVAGSERLAKQYAIFPAFLRAQGAWTLYRGRLKAILGESAAAAKDLNAAAKIFEGLVGRFQDVPVYRSFLGQTYMAQGQLDADPRKKAEWYIKARGMIAGALERRPDHAQDRMALADLDSLTKALNP